MISTYFTEIESFSMARCLGLYAVHSEGDIKNEHKFFAEKPSIV